MRLGAIPACGLVRNDTILLLFLLHTEGLAVGALVLGGVCLVGAHQDPLQRTEIGILTMVSALLNGTLNALVCVAIHIV